MEICVLFYSYSKLFPLALDVQQNTSVKCQNKPELQIGWQNICKLCILFGDDAFVSSAGSCTGRTVTTAQSMWWSWMDATRRSFCQDLSQMEMSLTPWAYLVLWLLTLNMGTYTQTHTHRRHQTSLCNAIIMKKTSYLQRNYIIKSICVQS